MLQDAAGRAWADLFLAWSADAADGPDTTTAVARPIVEARRRCVRVTIPLSGGRWSGKGVIFECRADRVEARMWLEGEGALTDVRIFAGPYSGLGRFGTGRFWSRSRFASVFSPEPTRAEVRCRPAGVHQRVDVAGGSVPGMEHWFATPAPLFFAMAADSPHAGQELPSGPWLGAGLAAQPGQNFFSAFVYEGEEEGFGFRLEYDGMTEVRGAWESPGLVLKPGAADPYAALAAYIAVLEEEGLVPLTRAPRERPAWWSRPIFCGWGAQCHTAKQAGDGAFRHARQCDYDGYLAALAAQDVIPGTVVIDDKWQLEYGSCLPDTSKWPDLKRWIAERHAAGQRVLLWWKAWDSEGLPASMCVTDGAGRPVATDPTNLDYEDVLRESVRMLLGADGLNADGLKTDFTARTPTGPGLRRAGEEWGVELLHRLLAIVHDEAHRVKRDALIVTHTPNPYFRDVTDMLRLNDINVLRPVVPQMRHRARVAAAACPETLIDTDNWPLPDRAAWREYLAVQPELGVPALYYATHVDSTGEPLTADDYAAIRAAWKATPVARRPALLEAAEP
jgi:hypothetical protein